MRSRSLGSVAAAAEEEDGGQREWFGTVGRRYSQGGRLRPALGVGLGGSMPDGLDGAAPQSPVRPEKTPRSWRNTLRKRIKKGAESKVPDGFLPCCMEVPPGVSHCAACGRAW